jgi:hypothetical protein
MQSIQKWTSRHPLTTVMVFVLGFLAAVFIASCADRTPTTVTKTVTTTAPAVTTTVTVAPAPPVTQAPVTQAPVNVPNVNVPNVGKYVPSPKRVVCGKYNPFC